MITPPPEQVINENEASTSELVDSYLVGVEGQVGKGEEELAVKTNSLEKSILDSKWESLLSSRSNPSSDSLEITATSMLDEAHTAQRSGMNSLNKEVGDTYSVAKERLTVAKQDIKLVSSAVLNAVSSVATHIVTRSPVAYRSTFDFVQNSIPRRNQSLLTKRPLLKETSKS